MAISIKVFGIKVLFKFKFLPEDAYKWKVTGYHDRFSADCDWLYKTE